jgi:flavin-dependent dehydrogenase
VANGLAEEVVPTACNKGREWGAYLLINKGRATLATVIYRDFANEKAYFEKTLKAFQQLVRLQMKNAREFGGYGNFFLRPTAVEGRKLYLGESAGFQDALFGLGMRYAMMSGFLAARSVIHWRGLR